MAEEQGILRDTKGLDSYYFMLVICFVCASIISDSLHRLQEVMQGNKVELLNPYAL